MNLHTDKKNIKKIQFPLKKSKHMWVQCCLGDVQFSLYCFKCLLKNLVKKIGRFYHHFSTRIFVSCLDDFYGRNYLWLLSYVLVQTCGQRLNCYHLQKTTISQKPLQLLLYSCQTLGRFTHQFLSYVFLNFGEMSGCLASALSISFLLMNTVITVLLRIDYINCVAVHFLQPSPE